MSAASHPDTISIEAASAQRHIGLLLFDGVEELDAVGPWGGPGVLDAGAPRGRLGDLLPVGRWCGRHRCQEPRPRRPPLDRRCPHARRAHPSRWAGDAATAARPCTPRVGARPAWDGFADGLRVHREPRLCGRRAAEGSPGDHALGSLDLLSELDPTIRTDVDARFVDDGDVLTSAGVSAGIDMALHLVARLAGADALARCAGHSVRPAAAGLSACPGELSQAQTPRRPRTRPTMNSTSAMMTRMTRMVHSMVRLRPVGGGGAVGAQLDLQEGAPGVGIRKRCGSRLALALDPPSQLEDAQGTRRSHDQGAGDGGQEQRRCQGCVTVPAEEGDLHLLGVLQDEDGQQQEEHDEQEDRRPETAGARTAKRVGLVAWRDRSVGVAVRATLRGWLLREGGEVRWAHPQGLPHPDTPRQWIRQCRRAGRPVARRCWDCRTRRTHRAARSSTWKPVPRSSVNACSSSPSPARS